MPITRLDRTETPRQRLIRETVAAFEKKNHEFLTKHDAERKKLTKSRANVFAADIQGKDMVLALHLPSPLYRALCNVMGEGEKVFHEQKELRWFMREFPRYTVPEKI